MTILPNGVSGVGISVLAGLARCHLPQDSKDVLQIAARNLIGHLWQVFDVHMEIAWDVGFKGLVGRFRLYGLEFMQITEPMAAQTLYRYVLLYNQQLPQSTLGSKTPLDAMQRWYESRPHLFVKRPCTLAGGDSYTAKLSLSTLCVGQYLNDALRYSLNYRA